MGIGIPEILQKLNHVKHVRGSIVVTTDGIVIASEMNAGATFDADTIAAFTSATGLTLNSASEQMKLEQFTKYVLQSDDNIACVMNLGKSYLVMLAAPQIDWGTMNAELFQTANMLKKTGRIEG